MTEPAWPDDGPDFPRTASIDPRDKLVFVEAEESCVLRLEDNSDLTDAEDNVERLALLIVEIESRPCT